MSGRPVTHVGPLLLEYVVPAPEREKTSCLQRLGDVRVQAAAPISGRQRLSSCYYIRV